jgi:antitoxin component of MazEF toxin-antitoxin module
MKTRIKRIGNSKGVHFPKVDLDQSALGEELALEVPDNPIVISFARPRQRWAGAAKSMAARGEDELLELGFSHHSWDEEEWEW